MPLVDGGVELHTRIAACPGVFGDHPEQIAGSEFLHLFTGGDRPSLPGAVFLHRSHKFVARAYAVVCVLEENRAVGLTVDGRIVAGVDQRAGLLLLLGLAGDELDDVGVVDVEDDHFGRAACLASAFDYPCEGVVAAHEAHRPTGHAAGAKELSRRAQGREV